MNKRKKLSKRALIKRGLILTFYTAATISFSASLIGTYAWYFYASQTGFEFKGTTAGNFGNLQIGMASRIQLPYYREYGLLEEDKSMLFTGYYIYWARGGLTDTSINYVSGSNGYATNKLGPVTTGKYSIEEDNFNLYNGPTCGYNYVPGTDCYSSKQYDVYRQRYTRLMFVFRIGDYTQGDTGEPNRNIYLAVDNVKTDTVDTRQALRFYIRNALYGGDTYLVAPMYKKDGATPVGGPLDLGTTGEYDLYEKNGQMREIAYGEFKEGPYYIPAEESTDPVLDRKDTTTFVANHAEGTQIIDMENSVPEVAEYYGGDKLMGHEFYVGKTEEFYNNYAFFDLTIYVEGWDPSVVDSADLTSFTLNLTFSA